MQNGRYLDGDLVAAIVYCRSEHTLSTDSRFIRDEFAIRESIS
jgi:hypothetical protein